MTEQNPKSIEENSNFVFSSVDNWFMTIEAASYLETGNFIFGYRKGGELCSRMALATSAEVPDLAASWWTDALLSLEPLDDNMIALLKLIEVSDSVADYERRVNELMKGLNKGEEYFKDIGICFVDFLKAVARFKKIAIDTLKQGNTYDAFNDMEAEWTKMKSAVSLSMKDVKRWTTKWKVALNFKLLTSKERVESGFSYELPRSIIVPVMSDKKGVSWTLNYTKPKLVEVTPLRIKYTALNAYAYLLRRPLQNITIIEDWLKVIENYNLSEYAKLPLTARDTREKWIDLLQTMFSRALTNFQLQSDINIETAADYMATEVAMVAIINAIHKSAIDTGETDAGVPLSRETIQISVSYTKHAHYSREEAWAEWWRLQLSKLGWPADLFPNAGSQKFFAMVDFEAKSLDGITHVQVDLDRIVRASQNVSIDSYLEVNVPNKYWQDETGAWYPFISAKITRAGRMTIENKSIAGVVGITNIENWIALNLRKPDFGDDEIAIDIQLPNMSYKKMLKDLNVGQGTIGLGTRPRYSGRVLPYYGVSYVHKYLRPLDSKVGDKK